MAEKKANLSNIEENIRTLRAEIKKMEADMIRCQAEGRENEQSRQFKNFRDSISNLEEKIIKKSTDIDHQVKNFKRRLSEEADAKILEIRKEETRNKALLEEKKSELVNMRIRLKDFQDNNAELKTQLERMKKKHYHILNAMRQELNEAIAENHQLKRSNKTLSTENKKLNDENAVSQQKIEEFNSIVEKFQKVMDEEDINCNAITRKIDELHDEISQIKQQAVTVNMTNSLKERQAGLIKKVDKYAEEMNNLQDELGLELEKSQRLQSELNKLRQDYDTCKVDHLSLTRKHQELEKWCEKVSKDKENFEEKLQCVTAEKDENDAIVKNLNKEIKNLNSVVSDLKEKYDTLEERSLEKDSKIKKIEADNADIEKEKAALEVKVAGLEEFKLESQRLKELLSENKTELCQNKINTETLQIKLAVLQETSQVLDKQMTDLEQKLAERDESIKSLEHKKKEWMQDKENMEAELQQGKIKHEETLMQNKCMAMKMKDLEDCLDATNCSKKNEIAGKIEELNVIRKKNEVLEVAQSNYEDQLKKAQQEILVLYSDIKKLTLENNELAVKAHAATMKYIDQEEVIQKLKLCATSTNSRIEELEKNSEEVSEKLEKIKKEKEESELKLTCTIEQQGKAINYLQSQNELLSKKKKFKLFGKDKSEESSVKGLSSALVFSKQDGYKVDANFSSCNQEYLKILHQELQELNDLEKTRCELVMEHRNQQMEDLHNIENAKTTDTFESTDCIVSKINFSVMAKTERKGTWDNCHFMWEDGDSSIHIILDTGVCLGKLCPTAGMRIISYNKMLPEINHNEDDIDDACILAVFNLNCYAGFLNEELIYFKTFNSDLRTKLLNCILDMIRRNIRGSNLTPFYLDDSSSNEVLNGSVVCSFSAFVHCSVNIYMETYLLGTREGLYSAKMSKAETENRAPVRIRGLSSVHRMEIVKDADLVIFITGSERSIMTATLSSVWICAQAAECSKPKLKVSSVCDMKNVSFFSTFLDKNKKLLLACLIQDNLVLHWFDGSEFTVGKNLSGCANIAGISINQDIMLFSCEKIFKWDLQSYELTEFIDASDVTLNYALSFFGFQESDKAAQIVEVSLSNKLPGKVYYETEYLICFSEMGVFVDNSGRRSRSEDIIWFKLPENIVFQYPFLYIFHSNCIAVATLDHSSFTHSSHIPHFKIIPMMKPYYLGKGRKSGSIIICSNQDKNVQVMEVIARGNEVTTLCSNEALDSEMEVEVETDSANDSGNTLSTSSSTE